MFSGFGVLGFCEAIRKVSICVDWDDFVVWGIGIL
jgi:hypothetical protein